MCEALEVSHHLASIHYLSRLFMIYLEIFVAKWNSPPKKSLEVFELNHFMFLQPRFLIPVMTISFAQGLYFLQTYTYFQLEHHVVLFWISCFLH